MDPAILTIGSSWVMTFISIAALYWQNKKIKNEGESQAVVMANEAVKLFKVVSDSKIESLTGEINKLKSRSARLEDMCRVLIFQLEENEIFPRIHLSQLED